MDIRIIADGPWGALAPQFLYPYGSGVSVRMLEDASQNVGSCWIIWDSRGAFGFRTCPRQLLLYPYRGSMGGSLIIYNWRIVAWLVNRKVRALYGAVIAQQEHPTRLYTD